MDFDQTQAIDDYEEEEEEQVEKDKAYPKKKEAAQLKVFSQQGFKESIFPVFQGDNVIGRDGKCKITIPIKALSKKHACIEVQRDLHLIYDCESKNRTKKGKSFLKPTIRYELKHGDMLTLGDVKCQYLIDLDTEEDEGDETGSETGSESMLPDATTEEELDADKPAVHEIDVPSKSAAKSGIPSDDCSRAAEHSKVTKPHKDEKEAYAADTDSDTDDERPLAVTAMATVLYSSEDEYETPARQKAAIVPSKQNASMEGQTLAFGLCSPDNVFRNRSTSRDSSSSAASHPGQTASVPPTLMLSSESDVQSDGKADLSSDNKQSAPKHPEAGGTRTQPTCEPTLVYGSESEDGSPIKRPRHPEARTTDQQNPSCEPTLLYGSESEDASPMKKPRHPEARVSDKQDPSCDPTLLYGSESEDASPIKKPKHPRASNMPTVLDESDSEEGTNKAPEDSEPRKDGHQASNEQTLLYSEIPSSSPGEIAEETTDDKQEEDAAKDAEATLPYAAAEMSSTDDEEESETKADVEKPTSYGEPTKPNSIEESGKQESNNGEDNMAADEYGEDCATQPYTSDSNFETESEPMPFVGRNAEDKSDANQPAEPSDVEATQAYCLGEEKEEGDSDSSDSQPLPIGPTAVPAHDDMAATLAYGLEATQAYNVTEKDDDTDDEEDKDEDERGPHGNDDPTLAYDLQATQAYDVGAGDDTDDEDNDKRESHVETVEGQSSKTGITVNRVDAIQDTIPYGLEPTQAYGADETDEEDYNDQDKGSRGGNNDERESHVETVEGQSGTTVNRTDAIQATIPYGLEATQAYGADETDDEDSNDQDKGSRGRDQGRGDEPTLAYGLAATLPCGGGDDDDEDNDDDSNKKVAEDIVRQENQATVVYGLDETKAYDDDNNDIDSVPFNYSAIEATQAYGIEEPSETEPQAQPNKQTTKKTTNKRVAFASSSEESLEVAQVDETEVDASVFKTDKKSKPSTSTAVDAEDQLQDSEDLIQPRSARSRRGRKKPVIQESQEEESQQTSERKSPTEGKFKTTNKLGKGKSHAESAVTSSTAETSEVLKGECGTLEDEKPVTTPASRKGRRGAMRVTIEPEEPDEETLQKTSTRRRGRKSKQAGDQEEGNKKETSTAAGRKRGRQTTKMTSVAEDSKEASVQVEETPAPKSRRGRKGKSEQTDSEAVSVLETPLKTAAVTTKAADSQTTAAVDVEPTVRRGGRGRGRKGTTTKETAQGVEALVDQEESIESQPVTVVEATPSRGKGRSRGRGKRTQSSTNEPGTTESLDSEVFTIPDEPQVAAVALPAKGKVRGKGRSRKTQPLSTESEVPKTPVVNEEELQPPESPTVASASKGRGRGRQARGKKMQPSNTELESSEDTSQTPSAPESSEGSQIRRGHGQGKVSRETSEQGLSSDMDVEGTPAKKSRRGKEPSVSRSPSLRQAKAAGESSPRVIFTGLVDKEGEKVVTSLGGELVDNIHSCTHLVTDKVRRTVKFLCGLASGQLIVLPSWLDACKRAKSFVDSTPFLVQDKDAEKQFKFDLHRSHEVALRHGLLDGYKVHVTKKVKPEPSQMKDIIQSAKGTFLSSMPRGKEDKVFVISCEEDRSICKKPLEAGIPVVSAEVLLTGILRQQLDLEEHKLFADEMSDTSQDTTSSSGQNKRRRQPSQASASSSPAGTKTPGSKRRKR